MSDRKESVINFVDKETHEMRMAQIFNARLRPLADDLGEQLNRVVNNRGPIPTRIGKLWKIADTITALADGTVPCKSGCSHCCHIPVALFKPEAEYIGSLIGRRPMKTKPKYNFNDFSLGYDKPCTFLVDDKCSIYEHRPTVCRVHLVVDPTNENCKLDSPKTTANLNLTMFDRAIAVISNSTHIAELRSYFPKVI